MIMVLEEEVNDSYTCEMSYYQETQQSSCLEDVIRTILSLTTSSGRGFTIS